MAGRAAAVVCGAGVAGISAAYHLAQAGIAPVTIVDPLAPLSLTSDKSTECYRNYWPGPGDAMVAYMNRSIDLLEHHAEVSGDRFRLGRRGYLFATADPGRVDRYREAASDAESRGVGALREHGAGPDHYHPGPAEGIRGVPEGCDLLVGEARVARHFPYLAPGLAGVLHVRRAGFLSAQQLGMYLLDGARAQGAQLVRGRVVAVHTLAGEVSGVGVERDGASFEIEAPLFVDAAGPYLDAVARLAGIELPVRHERHLKLTFEDRHGAMPRDAPLVILSDRVSLPWDEDEREALASDPATLALVEPYPEGVHGRPLDPGPGTMIYWTFDGPSETPSFPLATDPHVPEIYVRGMSRLLPGMRRYFSHLPRPWVDGGYYTKTEENRPLIGPLGVPGAYVCGAFSGFGIMAALAGGELLARHAAGGTLPAYAPAFAPARYADPAYAALLAAGIGSGEL